MLNVLSRDVAEAPDRVNEIEMLGSSSTENLASFDHPGHDVVRLKSEHPQR